jgi:hypothetical protein
MWRVGHCPVTVDLQVNLNVQREVLCHRELSGHINVVQFKEVGAAFHRLLKLASCVMCLLSVYAYMNWQAKPI